MLAEEPFANEAWTLWRWVAAFCGRWSLVLVRSLVGDLGYVGEVRRIGAICGLGFFAHGLLMRERLSGIRI
jgi:hypothetical protein